MLLELSKIRIDGNTQNRAEIDEELVSEYAQAIEAGAKFPELVVMFDGVDYWLVDGFHRLHAYKRLGVLSAAVDQYDGTKRDAQFASLSVNADHGKRRTNADKRKAVMTMLADAEWSQWSDREIAKACSVHHSMVSRVRSESSLSLSDSDKPAERTFTNKHGTQSVMKTSNIGKKPNAVDAAAARVAAEPEEELFIPEGESEEEITEEEISHFNAAVEELAMTKIMGGNPLAEALVKLELMGENLRKAESDVHFWKQRANSLTDELNMVKAELGKYKKKLRSLDNESI